MNYIKLYENWLNEAQGISLDSITSSGLRYYKKGIDDILMKLAKANGKAFEIQIRKNLTELRDIYVPNSLWGRLNTREGVEFAIKNFKDLFFISYGGTSANMYGNRYPLTGFTVKVNNALQITEADFFSGITIDNELWRSKEAVELKNIITNGNNELARGLAASIILLDLAVAITNGVYFISSSLMLKGSSSQTNKTLADMLNMALSNPIFKNSSEAYKELVKLGKNSNTFNQLKDVYTHPYNISIKREWKGFATESNYMEFIPYVKGLSLNSFVDNIRTESDFFAPLFVGDYMSNDASYSIDKAVEFMEAGGPSFLQTVVSKF